MPAPKLQRMAINTIAADTYTSIHPAVPPNRAFVGRVVVANTHSADVRFYLRIGVGTVYTRLVSNMLLPVNGVFEQVVVVEAGSQLQAYSTGVVDGINVTMMGQEVDN